MGDDEAAHWSLLPLRVHSGGQLQRQRAQNAKLGVEKDAGEQLIEIPA